MVEAAKASPAADNFDFDFGFATNPPGPIGGEPASRLRRRLPPAVEDPIADLIAAELDSADAEVGQEPRPVQPAPRSFPQPSAAPCRSSGRHRAGPVPFRPNQAPVPAQPQASKPEDRFWRCAGSSAPPAVRRLRPGRSSRPAIRWKRSRA